MNRVPALVRLFARTIATVLEGEGVDISKVEFFCEKGGCWHSNLEWDDSSFLTARTTHHRFAIGLHSMERFLDGSIPDASELEYPWLRHLPEAIGVKYSSPIQLAVYIAIHEASHLFEIEDGGKTPSEHGDLFESHLTRLLEKYWEVLT